MQPNVVKITKLLSNNRILWHNLIMADIENPINCRGPAKPWQFLQSFPSSEGIDEFVTNHGLTTIRTSYSKTKRTVFFLCNTAGCIKSYKYEVWFNPPPPDLIGDGQYALYHVEDEIHNHDLEGQRVRGLSSRREL